MKFSIIYKLLALILLFVGCSTKNNHTNLPSGMIYTTDVKISPLISGKVLQVNKSEGDEVKVGDTLVRIDTELMELQKLQTEAQQKEILAIRRGFELQKKQLETQLTHTEVKLKRQIELLNSGSSSQQTIDDITLQRDLFSQQIATISTQIEANTAQQNRIITQLAVINRQLQDGIIRSPMEGKVLVRSIEVGETATPQSILFILSNDKQLELNIYLTQSEIANISIGKKVNVLVDAYPNKTIEGNITFVSTKAEFTPKNIQTKNSRSNLVYAVKIAIRNQENLLLDGMAAEIDIK